MERVLYLFHIIVSLVWIITMTRATHNQDRRHKDEMQIMAQSHDWDDSNYGINYATVRYPDLTQRSKTKGESKYKSKYVTTTVWSSQARGSSDFTDYFIWVPIVVLIGGLGIAAIVKIILNGRRVAAQRQQELHVEHHPESNHADVQTPQMLSSRGMQPSAPLLPDIRRPVPSAPVLDSRQPTGGSIQRIEATAPPSSYQDLGHAPLDTSRYPGEMDTTAQPPSYDDVMKEKYIHP